MANEFIPVELYGANNDGQPRRYTINSGIAVSKGQLLALIDPFTASGATIASSAFAGVASMEKLSSDNSTQISCWTQGRFEAATSGAVNVGQNLTGTINNLITSSGAPTTGTRSIGYSLEDASNAETINMILDL